MADSKTSQQEAHDILMAKVRRLRLLRIPMVVAMLLLGFHVTRTAVAHYRTYQNNAKAVAELAGAAEQSAATMTADDRPSSDRPSSHETLKNGPSNYPTGEQAYRLTTGWDVPHGVLFTFSDVSPVDSHAGNPHPDADAADRLGAARPAAGPAVASPEWADAISGAVVWVASRALRPPVLTFDNESSRPSAEEPTIIDLPLDVDLISIVNPLSSGIEIHYMVNNDVFHLSPGQTHEMKNSEPIQLRYHRGGSFGDAIQLLTSGQYDFDVTDHGWDLVRRETRDISEKSP